MSDLDEKLKDHLLKYHLRDLEHDAEIVKLTGQNDSLFDDIDRLRAEIKQLQRELAAANELQSISFSAGNPYLNGQAAEQLPHEWRERLGIK